MSKELQKPLAERVKEFLQIDGEHGLLELAGLLRQFRNDTHPDRFTDAEIKTKAEDRAKVANALLDEMESKLQLERLTRKPTELAAYKPLYDMVQLQSDYDKLKSELNGVKLELTSQQENNVSLTKQLEERNESSLKTEIQHLQDFYRPSTRKFASLGLAVVLPAVLVIMSQMEQVSNIIQKYSPLPKQYITTALFLCMLLAIATAARKVWEQGYIKRKSEEVCSSKSAEEFMTFLKAKKSRSSLSIDEINITEFPEVEVFDFISGRKHWQKRAASLLGFQIYGRDTIALLSDIFIHNLLNRKLAVVSRAENMQRYFTIARSSNDDLYWFNKYQELATKK